MQACGILGRRAGLDVNAVVFRYRGQSFNAPELARLREIGVRIHQRSTMLATVLLAHWIGWRMNARVVPLGASTPVATLGHVRAALELVEQVRAGLLPQPRRIYIPFATGGSVAGLLIGLTATGSTTRVVAVQTVESIIANRRRLERLLKNTLSLLDFGEVSLERCLNQLEMIDDHQLGRGYRDVPAGTRAAISVGAKYELYLDPAFSGKAFAALLRPFHNPQMVSWSFGIRMISMGCRLVWEAPDEARLPLAAGHRGMEDQDFPRRRHYAGILDRLLPARTFAGKARDRDASIDD